MTGLTEIGIIGVTVVVIALVIVSNIRYYMRRSNRNGPPEKNPPS